MSCKLSTHVLDLTTGRPAAGLLLELHDVDSGALLTVATTNADGRTDAPLLIGETLHPGEYELLFHVGDYFGQRDFLDRIPIRFRITEPTRSYHVPLLCTPWAYSTYRGS